MDLLQRKAELVEESEAIIRAAQAEQRGLTDEEKTAVEDRLKQIEDIERQIELAERVEEQRARLSAPRPRRVTLEDVGARDAAERDELREFARYLRTGRSDIEWRTDAVMTTGTGAAPYGGYAVPTTLYSRIIAKRDQDALMRVLPIQRIAGRGTTVQVPVESGASQPWAATNEGAASTREAPDLARVNMTLAKYTKRIELTTELLEDEDARLLDWVADYIGRTLAKTHNQQIVTVVTATGAGADVTLGAAAAATATDIDKITFALEGEYANDARFVMRRATHGLYSAAASAAWQVAPGAGDWPFRSPVHYTSYMPAVGANNISIIYADWSCVGLREEPAIFTLRDPYSSASTGVVVLHHYARFVYAVLDSSGIVRGKHPAS
jgi:HK97 family phage major capsid protein